MIVVSVFLRWLTVLLLCLACTGCWDNTDSPLNEQKEAYFLRGKSLATSLDWPGAVDAYRKALEVNPRNASAHFELFFLYEQRVPDYAAAIYHGQEFLRMRPNSEFAEVMRQRITNCKMELAKNMPVGPVTPALQRDFERLTAENKLLRQQLDQMAQRLALATNRPFMPPPEIKAPTTQVNQAVAPAPTTTNRNLTTVASNSRAPVAIAAKVPVPTPATTKTHIVKARETMAVIARQHRVQLNALINANPGVDPKRIKPGQTLRVP